MIEKFSDYEGGNFIDQEGEFNFEITGAELMDSKSGNLMVKFDLKAPEGSTTVYHVLTPKARWTYNRLISAALALTDEQKKSFELDYETIHNQLVGKHVFATVYAESYVKEIKKPMEDGTYQTSEEERIGYKVDTTSYKPVV
jgi:hypothetical protein